MNIMTLSHECKSYKKVLCLKNRWLAIKLFDLDDDRPFIEFIVELVYLLATETFPDRSVMSQNQWMWNGLTIMFHCFYFMLYRMTV